MSQNVQPTPAEVRAVANQLLTWADELAARTTRVSAAPIDASWRDSLMRLATAAREVRRRRTETFPHLRLREPMWDVMLDLFIHQEDGCPVSLDHLILAGEAEAAVVRHAVAVLVTTGLVERIADRFDPNVVWLTLTPAGHAGMVEHFSQAADYMRPAVAPAANSVLAAA